MRHKRLLAACLAAGLALLAGCSAPSSGGSTGSVTLTYLTFETPSLTASFWDTSIANANKKVPGVTIKKLVAPSTDRDAYAKQLQASGQFPDLLQSITPSTFVQAGLLKPYDQTWVDANFLLPLGNAYKGKVYIPPTNSQIIPMVFYNKTLFTKAGLDVNNPPKTWADVRAAAKKIAATGGGVAGYADYSAGNTGGWHFTAELYSQGGTILSTDNKSAAFDNAQGKQVLQNLKDMRYADNSMGSRQLLQWADLLTNAAAGKVGMFIGAPDATTAIVQQFQGKYQDWAMAPMPGQDGAAKGTLGGGEGYFFRKDLTPDQVKAGLKWIAFEKLTPGKGQFDYARAKPQNQPVGLPQPLLFTAGSAAQKQELDLRKANQNVPSENFGLFEATPVPIKGEPANAQAIYAVLDNAMSGVLTNPNANIDALLKTAETKTNQLLAADK